MHNSTWIYCPICNHKTRLKVRDDTVIKNLPLFCPKCKRVSLVDIRQLITTVISDPEAKMHSQ